VKHSRQSSAIVKTSPPKAFRMNACVSPSNPNGKWIWEQPQPTGSLVCSWSGPRIRAPVGWWTPAFSRPSDMSWGWNDN